MKAVGLVDTGILLETLDVPGRNENHAAIAADMDSRKRDGHSLLIPVAVILETGNHIARLSNGGQRRRLATRYIALLRLAIDGAAPFAPLGKLEVSEMQQWFEEFPSWVSPENRELTDLTIKAAWEKQCDLHPARRVYIWSLDSHLSAFDCAPRLSV